MDKEEIFAVVVDVDESLLYENMKSMSGDVGIEEAMMNRKRSAKNIELRNNQNNEQNRSLGSLDADGVPPIVSDVANIPEQNNMKWLSGDVEDANINTNSSIKCNVLIGEQINELNSSLGSLDTDGIPPVDVAADYFPEHKNMKYGSSHVGAENTESNRKRPGKSNVLNSEVNNERNRLLGSLDADEVHPVDYTWK